MSRVSGFRGEDTFDALDVDEVERRMTLAYERWGTEMTDVEAHGFLKAFEMGLISIDEYGNEYWKDPSQIDFILETNEGLKELPTTEDEQ